MTAVDLVRIARSIVPPVGATQAIARVDDQLKYRAAFLIDGRIRSDPVGPAFDRPRDAIRLVDLLNGEAPAPVDEDPFWSKVDRTGGPEACWPWANGRDPKGYGHHYVGGQQVKAHRFALEVATGMVGDQAMHSCDNPPCCNPAHLSWGDASANVRDMVAKGRMPAHMRPSDYCRNGHRLDERALYVRPNGDRTCRTCHVDRQRARRQASRPGQHDLAGSGDPTSRDAAGQPEAPGGLGASPRTCANCGRDLPPGSRPQRRTCSGACRVAAKRHPADTDGAVTVSAAPGPSTAVNDTGPTLGL